MKYQIAGFEIDTQRFCITVSNKPVAVEPKVFDLLVYLIQNRQHVVTREELFAQIWAGREVTDTTLSNHVKSIRKLFGDNGELQSVVKTVRGRGYQFVAEVTELKEAQKPSTAQLHFRESTKSVFRKASLLPIILCLGLFALLNGIWMQTDPASPDILITDQRPYVLVLPFGVSSVEDNKWQPFAEQITREVIRKLNHVGAMRVIPSASAFKFTQDKSREYIRQTLPNVDFILDAMVSIDGQINMRITADMIDLRAEKVMWAKVFQSQINDDNFFSVQTEIANSVADSLKLIIGDQEQSLLQAFPTSDLAAYELYVAGQQQLNKLTPTAVREAIGLFEQAIVIDPLFEAAYVAKADAYRLIMSYFEEPSAVLPQVVSAVHAALKINPNSAEALSSLGLAYAFAWRWEDAWNMLNAAKLKNPRLPLTELGFALYYAGLGDVDGVYRALNNANRLDPLNIEVADWGHWVLAMTGELDAAVEWGQQKLQLHPDVGMLYSGASVSASLIKDHTRAIALAKAGLQLDPQTPYAYIALAQAYGHAGERDRMKPLMQQAAELERFVCPYETAVSYLLLGDVEQAFFHLNSAVSSRSNCLVFSRNDKRLQSIRHDPRYLALLTRIGLDDSSVKDYAR